MKLIIEGLVYMEESMNNILIDELLEENLPMAVQQKNSAEKEKKKLADLKEWFNNLVKKVIDRILKLLDEISTFIKNLIGKVMTFIKGGNTKVEIKRVEFNYNFFDKFIKQIDDFIGVVENIFNDTEIVIEGVKRSQEFVRECKKQITKERVMVETNSTTTIREQVSRLTKALNEINRACKNCKNVMESFKRSARTYDRWIKKGTDKGRDIQLLLQKYNLSAQVMSGYAGLLKQIAGYVSSSIKDSVTRKDSQTVIYAKAN